LAEFWMIEPEMAFTDLHGDINCADEYLRFCVEYVLEHNKEDISFFDKRISPGLLKRLENFLQKKTEILTYSEAIKLLQSSGERFEWPTVWGKDLQAEHERFLTEKKIGGPVVIIDYPVEIKAFYMRMNDDGKTVAAMDLLVPGIGELVGGSQREERLELLRDKMEKMGIDLDQYWWYLDLRRFGSVPHAGFGVGFERFIMMVTGMENIRDVIPFPRTPGRLDF